MIDQKRAAILILLCLVLIFRTFQSWPLNQNNSLELESPGIFLQFRQILASKAEQLLPQPQAALLNGIVLGLKSDLPADFKQALTNTSTVHIVVASGQNLTLLSGFILSFAPFLGRKKTILASVLVSVFYAFLTGLQIPIIRAAIMMIFSSLGRLFDREVENYFSLLLSAFLMLIIEPNWLLSISFQLSFLATVGVVLLAPELIKRANFLPEIIKEDLLVSLSAQLLTAAVIAANFHQFSLLGLLANALVLWIVSPIMIFGAFFLIIALISLNLAQLLTIIPNVMLTYFIYSVSLFNQRWSNLWVARYNLWVWFGYYIFIVGIYFWLRKVNLKAAEKDLGS